MADNGYTLIKNGTIITHEKTIYNQDILIEEQKIVQIASNIQMEHSHQIDATGLFIIPGLIDMHCEVCEPGYDYRENFDTVGLSAIYGGFTALTSMPNTNPIVDNKTVVEYIVSKSKDECAVPVYPYGSLTIGCEGRELAAIGEMQLRGIVAVSDGDKTIQDTGVLKTVYQYASMFDMPIILHSEDTCLSRHAGVNESFIATQLGLVGAPVAAETIAVAKHLLLADEYRAKIHLTHISTASSIELIRMAKKKGLKVTAETSPQYFSLDESELLGFNSLVKLNPPLRSIDDVNAVIAGIKDGTIDVISSDHKPHTIDSKDVEFDLASFGFSSLETALAVAYTYLVKPGHITMERLVHMMSIKPAQLIGVNRCQIKVGATADLTIIDPVNPFIVTAKNFKSKARYSAYEGRALFGQPKYTVVHGKKYDLNY